MICYPEKNDVALTITVLDASGQPYTEACNAEWKVLDSEDEELTAGQAEGVEGSLSLVVEAKFNEVASGNVKDFRRVRVKFTKPDDGALISGQDEIFFIRSEAPLIVGENSFVNYNNYLILTQTTPHLDNCETANEDEAVVALLEAHDRLMRLRYRLPISYFRQENVGYVSEVAWRPRAITDDDPFGWGCYRFTLDEVTPEEFAKLPEKFRKALAKAQVIEANAVLEPTDSIEEKRRKGMILETINEVKQMFSSTMPVNTKLTRESMNVLAPYLDTTVRLRRV